MKGISGIVATAILLALTVAGSVLLYGYVMGYLNTAIESGKLVVENAYYLRNLGKLVVEVRNIGMREAIIDYVEVLMSNGISSTHDQTLVVPPGETRQIPIVLSNSGDQQAIPQYVIIAYNKSATTEPTPVKIR